MKKIVNSHNQEFGYELLSALPYAYELFLKNELSGTISGKLSEPLYFFSPNHKINPEPRSWFNTAKARSAGIPYTSIHQSDLQPQHFPPLKEQYANDTHKYNKPTLCICNRANIEWTTAIINYFDHDILNWMFDNLKKDYHIVYFPIAIPKDIQDNEAPKEVFDDIALAKSHGVQVFTGGEHWNVELLKTFANCEHYITMNGGYSILASYFSGTNIIYSKPGKPQTQEINVGSFWRWYPNINGVRTLHVPSYTELQRKIKAIYIDKLPCANVIIRTSGRPHGFSSAMQTVIGQDYDNVNIVVTVDHRKSNEYTKGYPCRVIHPKEVVHREKPEGAGREHGPNFKPNEYIDQAQRDLKGYIFFLDDDDMFMTDDAISTVIKHARKDSLMVWKVKFPHGSIPNGNFGKKIVLCDVTGIGICYHSDMKHLSDWSQWKCADYRTASNFDKVIWIDKVLSGLQGTPGLGRRMDVKRNTKYVSMKKDIMRVQFTRDFQGNKQGEIKEMPWIIGLNFIHRQAAIEVLTETVKKEPEPVEVIETVKEKEEVPNYKTKVFKPRGKTKKQ